MQKRLLAPAGNPGGELRAAGEAQVRPASCRPTASAPYTSAPPLARGLGSCMLRQALAVDESINTGIVPRCPDTHVRWNGEVPFHAVLL